MSSDLFLTRDHTDLLNCIPNAFTVQRISLCKKKEVVSKEKVGECPATSKSFYQVPKVVRTFGINNSAKHFHTKNEQLGRKGIPLPNTPGWEKRIKHTLIKEYGGRDCRNTTHYELDKVRREIGCNEHFLDEGPLQFIVCFF